MEDERKESAGQKLRGRSRKQAQPPKKRSALWIAIPAAAGVLAVAAGVAGFLYVRRANQYTEVFFPNTVINGIPAAGKTPDQVKTEIASNIENYAIAVLTRSGTETITKDEIGLRSEFDGSLEEKLGGQNPNDWIKYTKKENSFDIDTMVVYDKDLLEKRLDELECLDEAKMEAPRDAKISGYDSAKKAYSILPETKGTRLDREEVRKAVTDAITNLRTQVDLDAAGCYEEAATRSDDAALFAAVAEMNRYVGAVVTHTFGSAREVLDGDTIHEWVSVNGAEVTLDTDGVAAYVKSLGSKYNTAYQSKKLTTSYGPTVTITGGNYGWRINQSKEAEAVAAIIRSGEQQTREPEYLQKAASRGENDYGDTYVEINLTAQHLFFYKDGKLVVESDFVSGNESRGWSTPAGAYPLTYKQRDAILKGEGYKTPVSYWMPFNGGIGLHDASWRGSFGGSIFKTGGSHGCINLPPSVAKTIYEGITAGMPVLCYNLEGTASKGGGAAQTKPAQTPPAATVPPETTPAQTPEQSRPDPSEGVTAPDGTSPGAQETAQETAPETAAPTRETQAGPGAGPQAEETTKAAGQEIGPGYESGPAGGDTPPDSGPAYGPGA